MSREEDVVFGERVRAHRAAQRLSLADLALRSGVSRAALSKVERGERTTSLANALKIADALGASLADLVGHGSTALTIVRHGHAPTLVDPSTEARREALLEPAPGIELIRYALPAGASPEPFPPHQYGTRETFVVLEGTLRITVGDFTTTLTTGDAATVPGDQPHRIANPANTPTSMLLTIIRPRST